MPRLLEAGRIHSGQDRRRGDVTPKNGATGLVLALLIPSPVVSAAGGAIHESACFEAPIEISPTLQTSALVAADIDGDGHLDVANASFSRVAWQRNLTGDGTTWGPFPVALTARTVKPNVPAGTAS